MNNERDNIVIDIIKTIIADLGVEVFCDIKKASAIVADYFHDKNLWGEKSLLTRVLATGAINFIVDGDDYVLGRKKALHILTTQEFIDESWAERALHWFDVALDQNVEEEDLGMDIIRQMMAYSEEAEIEENLKAQQTEVQTAPNVEYLSPIDAILDEYYNGNIALYNEDGESIEFEQIAVVPLDEKTYPILKPVNMPGITDNEALVFVIDEIDDEDCLVIVEDEAIVNKVFEEYYDMLRKSGIDID